MNVCDIDRDEPVRNARLVVDTERRDGGSIELFAHLCAQCIADIKAGRWHEISERAVARKREDA